MKDPSHAKRILIVDDEPDVVRLYKEIKRDPELTSIPVIIITAIVGYDGDRYAYEKFISRRRTVPPPDGFFPKPIDTEAFLDAVRDLLGEPAERQLQVAYQEAG